MAYFDSNGSYIEFGGRARALTRIRHRQTVRTIDITGFTSPDFQREVMPGEFEPAEVEIETFDPQQPFTCDRQVFGLTVSINGYTQSFQNAFVTSAESEAAVGEKVRTRYTFVCF